VLMAGARVGDRAVASPGQVASRAKIIHIDIDPAEIGKNMPAHIPIVGDLRLVLEDLTAHLAATAPEEWVRTVTDRRDRYAAKSIPPVDGYVEPKTFLRDLSLKLADDAVLCADVGQNQIWAANNVVIRSGRFLTSGGMGTMGYSVPCALGARLASGKQMCAVCGDGAFQMSMMELATLCQEQAAVHIVIMRNTRLGMVRELQDGQYKGVHSAVTLDGSPDFVKLAAAFGIPAWHADSNADALAAADAMLAHDGPTLLVCEVPPDYPSL